MTGRQSGSGTLFAVPSLGRTGFLNPVAGTLLLLGLTLAPIVHAQAPLAELQGRWVVVRGESQGQPLDVIAGGVLTIAGDGFEIRTAAGTLLKGTLRADTTKPPFHLDLLHADGERWEAIYAVDGDTLMLTYVPAELGARRPSTFTTSPESNATLVVVRREPR